MLVEEEDGVEGLVLCAGRDAAVFRKMGEERREVGLGQAVGVTRAAVGVRMEAAVSPNQVGVRLLRVVRIVAAEALRAEAV